jgi:hypothetical protein
MITAEERQDLINVITEKVLLTIPEVVGNLIINHISLAKINKDFYDKHPEFKDKKDIVASVVDMIEGRNPLEDYEEILKKAVPEIVERIRTVDPLNMSNVPMPDRDLNGVL